MTCPLKSPSDISSPYRLRRVVRAKIGALVLVGMALLDTGTIRGANRERNVDNALIFEATFDDDAYPAYGPTVRRVKSSARLTPDELMRTDSHSHPVPGRSLVSWSQFRSDIRLEILTRSAASRPKRSRTTTAGESRNEAGPGTG